MTIRRKLLPFTAILLVSIRSIHAEKALPRVPLPDELGEELVHNKYEQNPQTADAEFADFDILSKFGYEPRVEKSSTTTSTCNTWCKFKESIGLTIVGALLICISPCLMWKNEGRHVTELRRIDFTKNKAVLVEDSEIPSDENTGQLVHFIGKVTVDDSTIELSPGALNITAPLPNALIVKRTCMIYQKFERAQQETKQDVIGAGETTTTTYTLYEDWTPVGPQREQLEHIEDETNSRGIWDELVGQSGTQDGSPHDKSISEAAHVGGFGLSKNIIEENPFVFQCEWLPLPPEYVPEKIESLPDLHKNSEGNLTTVVNNQPVNGDVIVKYEYAADGFDASFIVKQVDNDASLESGIKFGVAKGEIIDEKCCGKISDDLGVIWMMRRGSHSLEDMIQMAKDDENTITKLLRVICWALLVAGWSMLFSIITTLLSTLPILGTLGKVTFFIVGLIVGTVCCCGVTAVAYIRYRPFLAISLITLCCGIAAIVIWRIDDAEENSSEPTVAPIIAPTKAPVKTPTKFYPDDEVMEYY